MKAKKAIITYSLVALASMGCLQAEGKGSQGGQNGAQSGYVQVEQLSAAEEASLVFMREEEKLARDVYLTLHSQWQSSIFTNIASSEQKHMDALVPLFNTYAVLDPVVDDTTGVFVNDALRAQYYQLTERGAASLTEALMVGAFIEELDMQDLQNAINEATHSDVISVYESLLKGSRNHLRSFVGQIENLGIPYVAQILEQAEVDVIVDQPMERGK